MPPPPSRRRSSTGPDYGGASGGAQSSSGGGAYSASGVASGASAAKARASSSGSNGMQRGRGHLLASATTSAAPAASAAAAGAPAAQPLGWSALMASSSSSFTAAASTASASNALSLSSSSSLGYTMSDAMRALRRLRDGEITSEITSGITSEITSEINSEMASGLSPDAVSIGGSGDGGGGGELLRRAQRAAGLTAQELEAYAPPVKREHGSMLCMLLEPGKLEFASHSTLRPRSSSSSTTTAGIGAGTGTGGHTSAAAEAPAAPPPHVAPPLPLVAPLSSCHSLVIAGEAEDEAEEEMLALPRPRRSASRAPSESASVPPTDASSSASGDAHANGSHDAHSAADARSAAGSCDERSSASGPPNPTAALVRKLCKRILKATLEPLADDDGQGGKAVTGDWSVQLSALEALATARLERLPRSQLNNGAPPSSAAIGRAIRAELLEVLKTGLGMPTRPVAQSRTARQPPAGLEQQPVGKAARRA